MRAALLLASLIITACVHDDPRPVAQRSTSGAGDEPDVRVCVDPDGDGFGLDCGPGEDCDDEDPAVTDECYRCATPAEGCTCAANARPVACDVDRNSPVTEETCYVGQRTCVDGRWSVCEAYGPRFD